MKSIRKYGILLAISYTIMTTQGQSKLPPLDKSPMDVSYYPVNYPILKIQDKITEPLIVRIIYSRPQKSSRIVFGELIEYGQIWRLGANEATEIEFFKEVKIGGKKIKKGRYTLYAIPNPQKWTLVLNTETDIWGAFKYNSKKDVIRTDVLVQQNSETVEAFTISFEKINGGTNMIIAWENQLVKLPITL